MIYKLTSIIFSLLIFQSCLPPQEKIEILNSKDRPSLNIASRGQGQSIYQNKCSSCHGDIENSNKLNRSELSIKISLANVEQMQFLEDELSAVDIESLSLALDTSLENDNTDSVDSSNDVDNGGGNSGTELVGNTGRGVSLFNSRNCISCHTGALYDQIRGKSLNQFNNAITTSSNGMGSYFGLSQQEKLDIIEYLKVLPVGGGNPSTKQSVFRDTVYQITSSQSCVNCHSSGLLAHGSNNLNEAYNAAINLVNFTNMPSSKFILTMKGENPDSPNHQVFSPELVIEMQAAINAWKDFEAPDGTQNFSAKTKAFRDSVYVVTRSHCVGCHRSGGRSRHASDDLFEAYDEAKIFTDFNNPAGSTLRTKAQSHGGGSYPTAARELTTAIEYWKSVEDSN